MAVNKVVYGAQTLIDLTDTTATAADVASGKYFYTNAGVKTEGTSSGGGGSDVSYVTGTFTVGDTGGVAESITIPYTGTGYPVTALVYVEGGVYNSSASGQSAWYNGVKRYALGIWCMVKNYTTVTPTYTSSGTENTSTVVFLYKNSTSSATTYARGGGQSLNIYSNAAAVGSGSASVRFNGSGTALTYYVGNGSSSTYGLFPGITYRYEIIYSDAYTPSGSSQFDDISQEITFTYSNLTVSDLTAVRDSTTNVSSFFATVTATANAPTYELDTYYSDASGSPSTLQVNILDPTTGSWEPFDIVHDDGTGTGMHFDSTNATGQLSEGDTARLIVTWIRE